MPKVRVHRWTQSFTRCIASASRPRPFHVKARLFILVSVSRWSAPSLVLLLSTTYTSSTSAFSHRLDSRTSRLGWPWVIIKLGSCNGLDRHYRSWAMPKSPKSPIISTLKVSSADVFRKLSKSKFSRTSAFSK